MDPEFNDLVDTAGDPAAENGEDLEPLMGGVGVASSTEMVTVLADLDFFDDRAVFGRDPLAVFGRDAFFRVDCGREPGFAFQFGLESSGDMTIDGLSRWERLLLSSAML